MNVAQRIFSPKILSDELRTEAASIPSLRVGKSVSMFI